MDKHSNQLEGLTTRKTFDLLDGATGEMEAVYKEVDDQRRIAIDANYPLEVRLESYEDIIDSEVGEIVKSPSTTAIGFQQMIGVEIFPMSEKWDWFISLKTFFTTEGGAAGRFYGLTLGGKVIYRWD